MLATVIISVILAGIIALILFRLVKNKKQGKTSCGCGCSTCGMADMCHKPKENK